MAQTLDNMTYTWNNGSTVFTGIKYNVADAASSASSLLMDLQVNGVSKFKVDKNGNVTATTGRVFGTGGLNSILLDTYFAVTTNNATNLVVDGNGRINAGSGTYIGWSSTSNASYVAGDLQLWRDTANTLAQRNGANPQTFNLYNTYTSGSSYERLKLGWNANNFEIKPESTGTTRYLYISGLPTTNPGPGILWNNAGVVNIGT